MAMTFADWVKSRRLRLGLTQAELGLRLGMSEQMVGKHEQGQVKQPRYAGDLRRWADALAVPMEDALVALGFLDEDGEKVNGELVFTQMTDMVYDANMLSEAHKRLLLGAVQATKDLWEQGRKSGE